MRRTALLLAMSALSSLGGPARADLLTGTVSYDSQTHLYIYSYTLDNRAGPGAINELNILVAPGMTNYSLKPAALASPAGWQTGTSISGGIANPPYHEVGTFWYWLSWSGLSVGDTQSGFRFASPFGPSTGTANNYFLFSDVVADSPPYNGIVEYGHIVAPQITPEPATHVLLGLALAALALVSIPTAVRFWRTRPAIP
jgi:hypothetical protein